MVQNTISFSFHFSDRKRAGTESGLENVIKGTSGASQSFGGQYQRLRHVQNALARTEVGQVWYKHPQV